MRWPDLIWLCLGVQGMRCTLLVGQCYRLSVHHKRLAAGTLCLCTSCVRAAGALRGPQLHNKQLHIICGILCAQRARCPAYMRLTGTANSLPTVAFQWLVRAELDASAAAGGNTLVYP